MKDQAESLIVRSEISALDVDIDILAQMNIDLSIRKQWDSSFLSLQVLKTLSENKDIIYQEMKMPFPISNRDFLLQRFYANNCSHPRTNQAKKAFGRSQIGTG